MMTKKKQMKSLSKKAILRKGKETIEVPLKKNLADPLGFCIAEVGAEALLTDVPSKLLIPDPCKLAKKHFRVTKKKPAAISEATSNEDASEAQPEEV